MHGNKIHCLSLVHRNVELKQSGRNYGCRAVQDLFLLTWIYQAQRQKRSRLVVLWTMKRLTFQDLRVDPDSRSQQKSCRLLEAPYSRVAFGLKDNAVMGSVSYIGM